MPNEQLTRTPADTVRADERIDRLPRWGLSFPAYLVLGVCYTMTFYDIAVIGVSLPSVVDDLHLSSTQGSLPVTANLVGFTVGALLLGTFADRFGRRRMLAVVITMLGVGSLLTAVSWDAYSLSAFRFLVGAAIGAQLSLASILIGEFAPAARRGRYVARTLVWAAVGDVVPAALAIPLLRLDGGTGWRVLFGLAALALVTLPFLRDSVLPESPRWLVERGRTERAERIVARMEDEVRRRTGEELPPVPPPVAKPSRAPAKFPLVDILRRDLIGRLLLVFGFWFFEYFGFYGFLGYETTLFKDLGVSLHHATWMTALGWVGGILGACLVPTFVDRIERKYSVLIGLATCVLGFLCMITAPSVVTITFGAFLASMASFLITAPGYAYTAEIFPTEVRASAMGFADGVGHLGGAVAPLVVAPLLAASGARPVFWLLIAAMAVSGVLMVAGRRTRGRSLTDLAR